MAVAALHSIDESGNIAWHCHNPACNYHNCAAWEDFYQCTHHPGSDAPGEHITAHISHPDIQYCFPGIVALPGCPGCKDSSNGTNVSRTFLKVTFSEQELAPPIVERDEWGNIASVTVVGAPNLTIIKEHIERRHIEVENLDALPDGTQFIWKNGKPYRVLSTSIIDDVQPAPWVARHQELHRQLQALGKTPPA